MVSHKIHNGPAVPYFLWHSQGFHKAGATLIDFSWIFAFSLADYWTVLWYELSPTKNTIIPIGEWWFHAPDREMHLVDHPLQCRKDSRISGSLPPFKSGCSYQTVFFATAFFKQLVNDPLCWVLFTEKQSIWKSWLRKVRFKSSIQYANDCLTWHKDRT